MMLYPCNQTKYKYIEQVLIEYACVNIAKESNLEVLTEEPVSSVDNIPPWPCLGALYIHNLTCRDIRRFIYG